MFLCFQQLCYDRYTDLVKGVWQSDAYIESPSVSYDPADHSAVRALGSLKGRAKHGEIYARNINERLAKAWANGEHKPVFRTLGLDEEYPAWEYRQALVGATGVTIQGGLDDFEFCFYTFKDLAGKLDSSINEAEAQKFSEDYASVCGLRDTAIRWMLTLR
jgi:hypothetical protein